MSLNPPDPHVCNSCQEGKTFLCGSTVPDCKKQYTEYHYTQIINSGFGCYLNIYCTYSLILLICVSFSLLVLINVSCFVLLIIHGLLSLTQALLCFFINSCHSFCFITNSHILHCFIIYSYLLLCYINKFLSLALFPEPGSKCTTKELQQ